MFEKIAIILVLNFIFFFKTLKYNYVSDDIPVFKKSKKIEFKNQWQKRWQQLIGSVRIKQQEDHLITMLIHAAICVLIYLVFGKSQTSFYAALLFTLNPMNNQGSIWISGRGYTLPAICLLLALAFPLCAPIFLYGCTSFTVGFLAPLAALGHPQAAVLLWLPLAWIMHRRKFLKAVAFKAGSESVVEDKTFHWRKLILATKTMGFYITLCLVPFRIAFFHNFLQSCAGNEIMKKRAYNLCPYFWVGLTAILSTITYSIVVPWGVIHTGLVWYFVAIAPFSNIRRNNQEIADRFCYIANIGLMVAFAGVLVHFPALFLLWMGMYAGVMWTVMGMYKDDYWIVEYSVVNDPHAWFGWHTRAMKRWDSQSYKEALIMWVMAKMISPKEFKLLFNLAVVLRLLKKKDESDAFLKLAQDNIIAGQEEISMEVINNLKKGKASILM